MVEAERKDPSEDRSQEKQTESQGLQGMNVDAPQISLVKYGKATKPPL